MKNTHKSFFSFCPVTESQIEKIVQGLPTNKVPGMDKITSRVLKDNLPVSLPIITHLFDKSFATGSFARSWKMVDLSNTSLKVWRF